MDELSLLPQLPHLELYIPAWQMAIFISFISICMLLARYKLALLVTYLFTLYWSFFLYFGQVIVSFGIYPHAATLYLMAAGLHVTLTLIAFVKEDYPERGQASAAPHGAA